MIQTRAADDFYLIQYEDYNDIDAFISEFKVGM